MAFLRIILFPFSLLYGLIVRLRNLLYDKHLLHSVEFDLPIICVGNLSVGGTGKTPMVEYLINLTGKDGKTAVLSRGYKRKTKGFRIADPRSNALQIGDEPMQMHTKYPEVTIAVAEQRVPAIPQILHERPQTQIVILDDAFQHRPLRAGMNILLTTYSKPFTSDYFLPTGTLRDSRTSAKRADVIVVTKCPPNMTEEEKNALIRNINPAINQSIFFSSLCYGNFYPLSKNNIPSPGDDTTTLLVCGIANPRPILSELKKISGKAEYLLFKDHHDFSKMDLDKIRRKFESSKGPKKVIVMTEKDAARLSHFKTELTGLPILIWPVTQQFLFDEGPAFDKMIHDFIHSFSAEE